MKFRNIVVLLLALCLVFALCACRNTEEPKQTTATPDATTTPTNPVPETTEPTVNDGKVTYTVKVVDESGAPVVGAMVQLCKEACVPSITDAEGVATYSLAKDDYKVSFVQMPEGYTAEKAEFYFNEGSQSMTITLKAADSDKVTYTVKVVDEAGAPIVGAMVQLCKEACVPAVTNAEGVATYNLAKEDYKVSFIQVPAGYTAEQTEYYFAADSYELTITLKTAG